MKKFDKVRLSEQEKQALIALIEDFENEDLAVRQRQIRTWKKQEFYWAGFTNTYWNEVAHDWRIYGYGGNADTDNDDQSGYYDKNINVYRAYLETIIAALSETVPPVKCLPDDGDNINDVLTAQNGTRIAELVYNHIDAPLLWVRALWIHSIQGMVAAYNYTDEDKEYGQVEEPEYGDVEEMVESKICPNCKRPLGPEDIMQAEMLENLEENEYDPGDDDRILHNAINQGQLFCVQCQMQVDPEIQQNKVVITRIIGTKMQPKARQCIEVNGGLFVKIPNWARTQKECPYLGYFFENHTSNIIAKYPELADVLHGEQSLSSDNEGNQTYERWGRISIQYQGELPINTPTEKHWWLRNSSFNSINDKELTKSLKKKFPDGAYVIMVNDHFVKACNECLDDHWTISVNPESNYVHYDPLGMLVTAVQEITSDLVSLELQCIEHSVPITFADPRFVNFTQYANNEIQPGALVPTKHIPGGKGIADGFHTLQTATVSPELSPFGAKINEMGQFVSGALPSVFGGAQPNSSRTASQYAMSRQQALQRLRITWKMINFWWKNIFGKVIPAYMKDMLEDERLVKESGENSFETIVIKKAQQEGRIGSVKLEAPEGLPVTMEQIADRVMELMNTGNEEILAAIGSPENLPVMRSVLGLNDFYIPGEDDREQQLEEINLMLGAGPIPTPPNPMSPQGGEEPSIMPEMMVDNHKISSEICRAWLVGPHGRQAKVENPNGYKNVLLHMQIHIQMMQSLMPPMPQPQPQMNQSGGGPAPSGGQRSKVTQLKPASSGGVQ